MKKNLILILICSLLLTGCLSQRQNPPDYVIMLTSGIPDVYDRCTGGLIDPWTIITADHCRTRAQLMRAVTQNGQTAHIEPLRGWPELDIALFRTDRPLYTTEYLTFGDSDKKTTALAFGVCPHYFSNNPKPLLYRKNVLAGIIKPYINYEVWHAISSSGCGGDSGGLAVQNNQVVGLISALETETPFILIGDDIYIVPSHTIQVALQSYQSGLYNK